MRSLLAALLLAAPVAQALTLSHAGYLLGADDTPEDGSHSFTFRITDGADATVWTSNACSLPVRAGYYAAEIGGACAGAVALATTHVPADAVRLLEVTVDGVVLAPKIALASAPTAADASRIAGLDLAALEARFDLRYAPASGGAGYVRIDPTSPQTGGVSLLGTVSAGAFVGDGAGLTNLSTTQITDGVLETARGGTGAAGLAANALVLGGGAGALGTVGSLGSAGEVLTSAGPGAPPVWLAPSGGGATSGFTTDGSAATSCTTAGAVRWTGAQFQGCNGTSWVRLDNAGAAAGAPLVTQAFSYTGSEQQFRVPADVTSITVKLWGAGGGGGSVGGWNQGFDGGGGGFTNATVTVTPGEILTVLVGQGGGPNYPNGSNPTFGGGGPYALGAVSDVRYGGSGGGRSALRRGGVELCTAGGGGGGGSRHSSAPAGSNAGGAGGGVLAQPGQQTGGTAATGATSSTHGLGGTGANANGRNGSQFTGGRPGTESYGGSGGGGYFGGGGGAYNEPGTMGGGGGGSGYVGGPGVSGTTTTGSGITPAGLGDPSYVAPAGTGGSAGIAGQNGLVVIQYNSAAPAPVAGTTKIAFGFTGGDQALRIPTDVSSIQVKLWGAGGGGGGPGGWTTGYPGGGGGFASGALTVTPGEILTVVVGQGGAHGFPNGPNANYGGGGGHAPANISDYRYGASGGGRSALRRGTTEVITAGGGGGGGSRHTGAQGPNSGGAGGGTSGQPGYQTAGTAATGGLSSGPGAGGTGASTAGLLGAAFAGGTPGTEGYGGGGGGGYFGGGGGAYSEPGTMGGGAGGSGFLAASGITDGLLLGGWGASPPSTFDGDYVSGIGVGGPASGSGGNGLVVVQYTSSAGLPAMSSTAVFTYSTPADQTFTVPGGVTRLHVKLWGAGGGGGAPGGWSTGFNGGAGGFTQAILAVNPGDVLTVIVGQAGTHGFPLGTASTYGGGGGSAPGMTDARYGGSGGGRSAIRVGGVELLTAGGGGGGGSRASPQTVQNHGGAGGGTNGENGYQTAGTRAGGGTQSGGGAGGIAASTNGTAGTPFQGGRPGTNSYGGGGGGGYHGGGGGAYGEPGTMGGGGGGSGYVTPAAIWGSTVTGWGAIPPGRGDPDYATGVANGAPAGAGSSGGHGRVVIRY